MPEAESLYDVPPEGHVHARKGPGRPFSVSTTAQMHPVATLGIVALAGTALALSTARWPR